MLVTGANRGIGFAIARELAELGNAVWLGSRAIEAGEKAADSLRAPGLDVTPIQVDLTSAATIEAAVDRISGWGRSVDVLVNNAGVLHEEPLLDLSDAEIAESIAVHLTGPLRLVRALAPAMVSRGYGRIVNVSSDWGSFAAGLGGPGLYGVTKAALNALTIRLARAAVRGQGERDGSRMGSDAHGRGKRDEKPGAGGGYRRLARDAPRGRSDRRVLPRPETDRMVTPGNKRDLRAIGGPGSTEEALLAARR